MPITPVPSCQNETGDFDHFAEFARRIVSAPHAEIKGKLDAKREAKRVSMVSASRVSASPSTAR
jgi:hypothetical protein